MKEVIERIEYVKVVKRIWSEESFAGRTGITSNKFRPNRFTNDIQ